MTQYSSALHLLTIWLKETVVDGIDFWGPKLLLGESPTIEEQIYLQLEGDFILLEAEVVIPSIPPSRKEEERLGILCKLRRKRIIEVELEEATLNLVLTFDNLTRLVVFGHHDRIEPWKVEIRSLDYCAVIACPNKELAIWEPTEKESSHVRVQLQFYSDKEAFDLSEFKKHLDLNEASSYSRGDKWHDDSRLISRAIVSRNITNEKELTAFINYLQEKEIEIDKLKNLYSASLNLEFIMNIHDDNMPYSILTTEQLQFITRIGAELHTYLYNYRG